jgi:hypothetical protein
MRGDYEGFFEIPEGDVVYATYSRRNNIRCLFKKHEISCSYIKFENTFDTTYNVNGSFAMASNFRKATSEEIEWLELCIQANELVPKPDLDIPTILEKLKIK